MEHSSEQSLVIVITGPVGSGKTTTASELHELLAAERIPSALIDMDYLRQSWPVRSPFNSEIGYKNLKSVVENYRRINIGLFVVADVVETREQVEDYRLAAPGATVTSVRLRVPLDVIEDRLRLRQSPETLVWYLQRAPELEEIQSSRNVGDVVIDVGLRDAMDVAREIYARLNLDFRARLGSAVS